MGILNAFVSTILLFFFLHRITFHTSDHDKYNLAGGGFESSKMADA
jgi:hypothetical protein